MSRNCILSVTELSFYCKENLVTFGDLSDFGWKISNDKLIIVWDIDLNFQKIERTVQWYTKECGCKTGCMTNRCKCRKGRGKVFVVQVANVLIGKIYILTG